MKREVTETDHTLDACGLHCPMPLLKTRQVLRTVKPGETLAVWATDAGACRDIPAYLNQTGHVLLGSIEEYSEQERVTRYGFFIQAAGT